MRSCFLLQHLKSAAKQVSEVVLVTDLDRKGETII
nr:toprim domain-containing protein [Nostoc sp. FACHB-280]